MKTPVFVATLTRRECQENWMDKWKIMDKWNLAKPKKRKKIDIELAIFVNIVICFHRNRSGSLVHTLFSCSSKYLSNKVIWLTHYCRTCCQKYKHFIGNRWKFLIVEFSGRFVPCVAKFITWMGNPFDFRVYEAWVFWSRISWPHPVGPPCPTVTTAPRHGTAALPVRLTLQAFFWEPSKHNCNTTGAKKPEIIESWKCCVWQQM